MGQITVGDLDVRVVLPDPVENRLRLWEGQCAEQMLGLLVGSTSHGERGGELHEA